MCRQFSFGLSVCPPVDVAFVGVKVEVFHSFIRSTISKQIGTYICTYSARHTLRAIRKRGKCEPNGEEIQLLEHNLHFRHKTNDFLFYLMKVSLLKYTLNIKSQNHSPKNRVLEIS